MDTELSPVYFNCIKYVLWYVAFYHLCRLLLCYVVWNIFSCSQELDHLRSELERMDKQLVEKDSKLGVCNRKVNSQLINSIRVRNIHAMQQS